jgi:hypothetical protein
MRQFLKSGSARGVRSNPHPYRDRGLCGISKGGGKGGKHGFGFPRFPRPGFFHSPSAAAFVLLKKSSMVTLLPRTPRPRPDSSWLAPFG